MALSKQERILLQEMEGVEQLPLRAPLIQDSKAWDLDQPVARKPLPQEEYDDVPLGTYLGEK